MTLSAPIPTRHDFSGNDVNESFSYTLKITDQDHIKLVHTDTDGLENTLADPLVVDVDYTVNGVDAAGGGTVDFPKAGSVYSTLASGEKLSILYVFPIEQELDLPNLGRMFNEEVEKQLDYMTVLHNQHEEKFDRSIKLVDGSTLTDIAWPEGADAAARKNRLVAWNDDGDALELASSIGTFRGDWATATAYNARDTVKDTSNNNIYQANTTHTSTGSQPISSNADVAKWDLLVDAANLGNGVNVRAFGAVGDGVTDDTSAIQAAIDSLSSSFGVVFFPVGLYQISSTLKVSDRIILFGEGQRSLIRANASMEANMLENSDTTNGNTYIIIDNLGFDGNRANQSSTGGILNFNNIQKFVIRNCFFFNAFNDGIFIGDETIAVRGILGFIINNYIEGCGTDSITTHNSNDILVQSNICYRSGQRSTGGSGVMINDTCARISIKGNVCRDASGVNGGGIYVQKSSNCVVEGNICEGNAASGIETDTGEGRHAIANNNCVTNSARGIYVLNVENTISGNIVNGNGSHGISILSPGIRNIVTGNIFQNNTGEGIENDGAETTITGNVVSFNDFNGIKNNGADNVIVSSNICRNNSQAGAGSYSGIRVIDSDDGIYTGNRCFDTQGSKTQAYGVRETGTSDRNIYQTNNFRDNLTAPYILVGSDNIVQDNMTDESLDVASSTTTTLPDNGDYFNITGTTAITSVTASRAGRTVVLKFAGILTFTDGSNLKLVGNFSTTADDTIILVCDGTDWFEISRSVN